MTDRIELMAAQIDGHEEDDEFVDEFTGFEPGGVPGEPAPDSDAQADASSEESSDVQAMQALLDAFRDPTIHEVQDPRHKRVIDELEHLAYSNIADVFENQTILEWGGEDDDGEAIMVPTARLTVADIKQLPRHVSAAIRDVKITRKVTGDVIEVKLYDKTVALDKLMRHHGLLEKDNKQKATSMKDNLLDLMFAQTEAQGLIEPQQHVDEGDL